MIWLSSDVYSIHINIELYLFIFHPLVLVYDGVNDPFTSHLHVLSSRSDKAYKQQQTMLNRRKGRKHNLITLTLRLVQSGKKNNNSKARMSVMDETEICKQSSHRGEVFFCLLTVLFVLDVFVSVCCRYMGMLSMIRCMAAGCLLGHPKTRPIQSGQVQVGQRGLVGDLVWGWWCRATRALE